MKRIVYTYGVYDLLHVGHLNLMKSASLQGDYLIVGVVKDKAVKTMKGSNRPVINETDRAKLVDNLKCVNKVVLQDEFDPSVSIKSLFEAGVKINTLVLGEDQKHLSKAALAYLVAKYDIKIVRLERTKNVSTSDIVKKLGA